ncbi:Chromosome partition protein Smc [Botrimarina colliarenosi]|uniref:Chromosome partition protein Smc n=1 Tax=Botrimarina colliarenosi TaxID=2528001 RepID=A0A5C6AG72_9BACT|nr:c-type cytochrome domain-containing protein [Botrimarina colliarenosi]TWT98185.1 Chromosome partition protein Smc [Botrimarina colliarenosi]
MTPLRAILIGMLSAASVADGKVTFEENVKPIFREHCAGCHNQDDAASDFAADGFDAVVAGGAGGEVVSAGDPDGSRLWRLVTHAEEPAMPPGGDKLPDEQLAVIKAWIEGGLLKNASSKPMTSKKPAIAAVEPGSLGKPTGEPAMPAGLYLEPVVTADTTGPIESLATSPWAPLAAVPWQRQVALYHAESHQLLGIVPYLDGAPHVVRFSRDGSLLLVAGGQEGALGAAAIYDVVSGARIATVGDELDAVLAADISPDNQLVAIGGPKKKVRVYRTGDGSLAYTCEKHTDWITAVAFSADGELLATGDRSAGLRLWQAAAGHERAELRGHSGAVTSLAWRPGLLASTSEDGTLRLWNPEGVQVKTQNAHGGGALSVAFAQDGRLVTAGRDRRVKLWKADGAHEADLATLDDIALAAAFLHGGKRVLASDWSGQVEVLDIEAKKSLTTLAPNPPTLDQRVADAESRLNEWRGKQAAAAPLAEAARAALKAGQAAHAAFESRLADAQRAQSNAQHAADEAAAMVRGRSDAEQKAKASLASAEAQLTKLTAELNTARAAKADNIDALVAAQADADSAMHAAAAALGETQTLRVEADGIAGQAGQRTSEAEKVVAQVESQRAGLPDLAELEANRKTAAKTVKQADRRLEQIGLELKAATAERDRYAAAVDELARHAETTVAGAKQTEGRANELAAKLSEADEAARQAAEKTSDLKEQLERLRDQLKAHRQTQSQTAAVLAELQAEADAQQEQLQAAQRQAQIAEALLSDLKATNAWRAERAASEQTATQ